MLNLFYILLLYILYIILMLWNFPVLILLFYTNLLSHRGSHLLVLEPFLYVYVTAVRVYVVYAHI